MRGGKITIQQVALDAFGNALGASLAEAATRAPTRTIGAGRASDAGEYSGQGVSVSAAQVDGWGPKFNVPAYPLVRTDWDLFSGGTPKLGNSMGAYGAYDDVAGLVDPETGATTYPVRTPAIESSRLPPMAPLPRRPMPESSAGQYVYGRVVEAMDSITENLDRMAEDPGTPTALRFAAAMARNPATWIPVAVKGLAGGGGYAFDSQFRSQINTGVGDFFSNDPVGTTRAAATRYWDDNSSLEIVRDTFNLVAGGLIGTPLAKLPGLALGETASLLGKAGEAGLRWSQRLNDHNFELMSVPSMRYQAGAIGLTVRNLRAEVTQMLPEGFELQRISRGGAAIVRYGEDTYYSVPKVQHSLIPELRTMDTMGDVFTGRVQRIADRFDLSMLSREQQLRLNATPDGWMKDRFLSAYKGSNVHTTFGRELQLMPGGSAYSYSGVGPDVVSRIGGTGLKYEITQLTPSLNAIYSHAKKYPDQLLRYVTYR
jgi:hypothetical protein